MNQPRKKVGIGLQQTTAVKKSSFSLHDQVDTERHYCEGRKELAQTMVRRQLILFSKITGAFLLRTFGRFLHVPTTQIYCLTGAIIIETRITNTGTI